MSYRYVESGLEDVLIVGLDPARTVDGEEGIAFPRIGKLHRIIAEALLSRPRTLSGAEARFLRAEMGLSPAALAGVLAHSEAEIDAWENGRADLSPDADADLRRLAAARLDLSPRATRSRTHDEGPIVIDGSDPTRYRLLEPEGLR